MEPYLHLAPRRTSEPPIFSPMFEHYTKSNWSSLKGIKVYKRSRLKEKCILKAEWDRAEDNLPNCPKCYEPNPDYQSKGWVRRDELIKDRPVGSRPLLIDIKCRRSRVE
jgi:hypothetical protein